MRLSGETAFITGGTSGIGLATLEKFIEQKADGVDAVATRLGKNCAGFVADAGEDEAMVAALSATSEASGGIDVIFANAGHYVNAPLGETSRETLQQQFSVVTNTFMTVQLALPHLREGASIILMGSLYATMGPPGAGAYAASKAGMETDF